MGRRRITNEEVSDRFKKQKTFVVKSKALAEILLILNNENHLRFNLTIRERRELRLYRAHWGLLRDILRGSEVGKKRRLV